MVLEHLKQRVQDPVVNAEQRVHLVCTLAATLSSARPFPATLSQSLDCIMGREQLQDQRQRGSGPRGQGIQKLIAMIKCTLRTIKQKTS